MALNQSKKKTDNLSKNSNRRNVWLLVISALIVVASIFAFTPPTEKINQGLDIQGGLSVVLTANSTDGSAITSESMEKSRRLNSCS